MRKAPSTLLLLPSVWAVAALPAQAAPIYASLDVQARAGYGTNPYLVSDENAGSLLAGIRLTPMLTTATAKSETSLSGFYDYTGYARRYGHTDAYGADLRRSQQFNARLSGIFHAGFTDSLNSVFGANTIADEVTLGQRTRQYGGDFSLSYQPSERDHFDFTGRGMRVTYPGHRSTSLSDYTDYGGTLSYMRSLNARTQVGASLGVDRFESHRYGDSTSLQPGLVLDQLLGRDWRLNAHVGAIIERTTLGPFRDHKTTVGFGAKLCKQDPRYTFCVEGARDTAPSGLGGLRTATHGTASIDYKLSERSTLTGSATYGRSTTHQLAGITGLAAEDQNYIDADAGYSYRLTERITVGGRLSYLYRKFRDQNSANGVAVALNATARFGRTR